MIPYFLSFQVWIGGLKVDGPNPGPEGWVWINSTEPLTSAYMNFLAAKTQLYKS